MSQAQESIPADIEVLKTELVKKATELVILYAHYNI